MSFFDAILGRSKPVRSQLDNLFGLSTADVTLQTEFGLQSTGGAAICFRPVSSGDFAALRANIEELLGASSKDAPLTWRSMTDSYGYQWIILQSSDFSNLVATVHMINTELQDAGFGDQLLASVFQFRGDGRTVYWMYNYKRGSFYPFVPSGSGSRDNGMELRLSAVMTGELTVEKDMTKWYPLWGIPLA